MCDYQYLILSQEIIFFYLFIYLAVIWDIWEKPYHGYWHHSCLYKTCGVTNNDLTSSLSSYIMTYRGAGVLTFTLWWTVTVHWMHVIKANYFSAFSQCCTLVIRKLWKVLRNRNIQHLSILVYYVKISICNQV